MYKNNRLNFLCGVSQHICCGHIQSVDSLPLGCCSEFDSHFYIYTLAQWILVTPKRDSESQKGCYDLDGAGMVTGCPLALCSVVATFWLSFRLFARVSFLHSSLITLLPSSFLCLPFGDSFLDAMRMYKVLRPPPSTKYTTYTTFRQDTPQTSSTPHLASVTQAQGGVDCQRESIY